MYLTLIRLSQVFKNATLANIFALGLGTTVHAASVTQEMVLSPTTASGWTQVTVGSVDFANGTNNISALTGNMSVQDQGWGGHDFWSNHLRIGLFENGTQLWSTRIAGAGRAGLNPIVQSYDISQSPTSLSGLNAALAAVAWTPTTDLKLQAYTNGLGWPGWQIQVNSGNLSVTSSVAAPVPLPAGAFLILSALGAIGFATRAKRPNSRSAGDAI